MGISERKERQRAELRDTILEAARRIFLNEGAEALTMRRIAEDIEYSPGTIYLYFANREEIALQLVREGFERLLSALRPAASVVDPIERLRALGRAYADFGLTDSQTYKLIFMEDAKFMDAVLAPTLTSADDPGQRAFNLLAESVREAVATGRFSPIDPGRAADVFWSALHGVLSLAITCPRAMSEPIAVAATVTETLIAGLRADAPAA